jgi:tight adherence protein B
VLLLAAAGLLGAPLPLVVATAVVGPVLPVVLARRRWGRQADARRSESVEVVNALAAEMRAGRPPGAALGAVAAVTSHLREPLTVAAAAVANGAAVAPELARIAALPGCAAFRSVAAAWTVTERLGGPVADVLERVGAGLDDERSHRAALDAALAGPRATMTLLALLPALGVLLGTSMGAEPLDLLLHRPLGWGLCAGAAVLDTLGVLWVRRIARAATR